MKLVVTITPEEHGRAVEALYQSLGYGQLGATPHMKQDVMRDAAARHVDVVLAALNIETRKDD